MVRKNAIAWTCGRPDVAEKQNWEVNGILLEASKTEKWMKKVNEQNKQNPNNLTMSKCQSIVIYWVKPLLVMPASHVKMLVWVSATLLPIHIPAKGGLITWAPAVRVLQPDLALAIAAIWEVNHRMKDFPLFVN